MGIGPNPILEKEMVADGALASDFMIVKKGANEDDAAPSTAVGDSIMGVAQHDAADNASVRVMMIGISKVIYGGNITQGQLLTVDSSSRAVAAAPAGGANNTIIGRAMMDGVISDVGRVLITLGQIQGA